MSSVTSTWPSHFADAPMPMIGAWTLRADLGRDVLHHAFDDDAEGARLVDRARIADDLRRFGLVLPRAP